MALRNLPGGAKGSVQTGRNKESGVRALRPGNSRAGRKMGRTRSGPGASESCDVRKPSLSLLDNPLGRKLGRDNFGPATMCGEFRRGTLGSNLTSPKDGRPKMVLVGNAWVEFDVAQGWLTEGGARRPEIGSRGSRVLRREVLTPKRIGAQDTRVRKSLSEIA